MRFAKSIVILGAALLPTLASTGAWAHWCDDLWSSGYDIVVRPDSDTSPKQLYVENRWGYQLTNFKLTATSSSGGAITLTPPTTLKVPNTLLPGEKGIWKITAGNPATIEDITFDVRFGDTLGSTPKQWGCYPVLGARPVMVVKNNGDLFPTAITGIDNPKPPTDRGCSLGDVGLGTSLQDQTIADWEDESAGLDALMHIYCSGRGSWGTAGPVGNYAGEGVSPAFCKDSSSWSCPANKPTASPGSRSDYMHLWAAGALAIRKSALGARLPVVRKRLKCGANDGDPGIAGYTLFVLGYLGDDAEMKSYLQTQANARPDAGSEMDIATIAKAALYLMGDTTQKSAVQACVQSSSVWVKVACAGALGIVDKDDTSVNSAIIPEVKWIEPDTLGGTTDNGKGMYAAHILEIVAFDRRGWVFKGNAEGPVTFYGEPPAAGTGGASGTGGTSGSGGAVGSGGTSGAAGSGGTSSTAGSGGASSAAGSGGTSNAGGSGGTSSTAGSGGTSSAAGSGGASGGGGSGGRSGSGGTKGAVGGAPGSGGAAGAGGGMENGGQGAGGAEPQGSGGAAGSDRGGLSASGGGNGSGGSSGQGGKAGEQGATTGCKCSLGGRPDVPALMVPAAAGLALLLVRRRRRNR